MSVIDYLLHLSRLEEKGAPPACRVNMKTIGGTSVIFKKILLEDMWI